MEKAIVNLPYGIDSFEQVREEQCYYIDKTGFIDELLSETFSVNLITRPRRFGKTLVMSMLSEFFDIRKDSRKIFEGLEITGNAALCRKWMNQWPVLFLTLKDVEGNEFSDAYGLLMQAIAKLCMEHDYLAKSRSVDSDDKEAFLRLKARKGNMTDVQCALDMIMRMMKAHYGKKVILLIDEYDVPLAKANDKGYYEQMLNVVKTLLGMAWKSNPSLKFAVVTGCLRIAKESIFTGANNFISNSISDVNYNHYFGFMETEVQQLLHDTGLDSCLDDMKLWYDGYRFGGCEIYCPWDVLNHVRALMKNPCAQPGNHWLDTSHNDIIRKFIDIKSDSVNEKFEILLAGGVIQELVFEDLNYDNANSSEDYLWSILYLTGYLTQAAPEKLPEGMLPGGGKMELRIPNEEVKTIFAATVNKWFTDKIEAKDRREFFKEWWNGEDDKLSKDITDMLFETISYYDYKEEYYHAFITGLFSGAGFSVSSNSEQGMGRADIIVKDRRRRRAIVIEAKWSKTKKRLEKACEEAIEQIEEMQYARKLQIEGYETILCYGTAFWGKTCLVKFAGNCMQGS